jgi:probable HAF family extracellular repeat protein
MPSRVTRPSVFLVSILVAALWVPSSAGFRAAGASAPPVGYEVEDIGQPKSATGGVRGQALNDDGTIAGVAVTDHGQRVVLYKRGKFTYLDAATGVVIVSDVSDDDVVVGGAATDPDGTGLAPMVWRHEEVTRLPTLGGETGLADAIGDDGTVVGTASTEAGEFGIAATRAAIWTDGAPAALAEDDGDYSEATDLNAKGVIVGLVQRNGFSQAVLWRDGKRTELGTLGGARSSAAAINDSGQIVGESGKLPGKDASHPFVWQDGTMTELPTPDAHPYATADDLNDAGQIVGNAYDETGSTSPLLWEDGEAYDLNSLIPADSGITVTAAVAINAAGQILCIGLSANADGARTLLLTPAK